jgi:hypothetical protein
LQAFNQPFLSAFGQAFLPPFLPAHLYKVALIEQTTIIVEHNVLDPPFVFFV